MSLKLDGLFISWFLLWLRTTWLSHHPKLMDYFQQAPRPIGLGGWPHHGFWVGVLHHFLSLLSCLYPNRLRCSSIIWRLPRMGVPPNGLNRFSLLNSHFWIPHLSKPTFCKKPIDHWPRKPEQYRESWWWWRFFCRWRWRPPHANWRYSQWSLFFLFFPDLSFSQMVDSLLWGCSSSCNYGGQVPEKPTEETVSQMSFKVPLKSAPVLAARTIKDVTWITCIMCSPFFVGQSFEDCKSKNLFWK